MSDAESTAESRWPTVLGTLGMVLGAITALDMIDDLLVHPFFTEDDWAEWVGSDVASMCRAWAKLAVVWAFVVIGSGFWWVNRYGESLPGVSQEQIEGAVIFGLVIAAAVLLAYPVFLLYWFSKDDVKAEVATWSE